MANKSVQGRSENGLYRATGDTTVEYPGLLMITLGQAADAVEPWSPIYPNRRDRYLKAFSRQETMVSNAIYTLKTRMQTLNHEINGPPRAKAAAMKLLKSPGLGDSFLSLTGKVVDDLLTSDNGAFVEKWGPGNPTTDLGDRPVVGFGHLDSRLCWRTFDPEYPVIYTNPQKNTRHKLHRSRVIMTADNVQPIELARGIGFCAVSRALQWIKIIRDIVTYRDEKVSGRFTRAIGMAKGVTRDQLAGALQANEEDAVNAGWVIYKGIPILAAPGMQAGTDIDLILKDLASIPDGFEFESDVTLYAYILAWAFGTDAREFWPATASGATKGDATVQNMKSRGKGIGFLIQTLEWMWRQCLPEVVTFEYDYSDDEQDKVVADIHKVKVDTLNVLVTRGAISPLEMRALAIADGIINPDVLDSLELPADSDDAPGGPQLDAPPGDAADTQADEDEPDTADRAAKVLKKTIAPDALEEGIKTQAAFGRSIRQAVRGLWAGVLLPLEFDAALLSAIRRGFNQAWTEGAAECGILESERTEEETLRLNTEINLQIPYIGGFRQAVIDGSKANAGKLAPLLKRAELWENQYQRIVNLAKTIACADKKAKWVVGPTEHCTDCARVDGKVYRLSIWAKYGWQPQSYALECKGFKCRCALVITDDPVTKGRPPSLSGSKIAGDTVRHFHE